MRIEYFHASKYGNGAAVADHFKTHMSSRDVSVSVHHIRDVVPDDLPDADLYVFSSPGRMGKPIARMRRFLEGLVLPPGSRFAVLTTEMAPGPDRKTGEVPTEEELAKHQRVRPMMTAILKGKGLDEVASDKVHVTAIKGPLEDGWQDKVEAFADQLLVTS